MLGTRKTVQARKLFDELPLDLKSNSSSNLFSSDSSSSSSSTDLNMTDSSSRPTVSDLTNPFAGVIDLTDKVGLSLFTKATEGLDKDNKFNLSQETARKTVEAIEQANQAFFWGHVCFKITAAKDSTDYDLITQYDKLKLTDVIEHSKTIWGSGTGYDIPDASTSITEDTIQKRIRSSIISKWLANSMTAEALKDIMLDKDKFQFRRVSNGQIENDGIIMLKLILTKINPSTRVGVRNLINKLIKMDLADYKEDVVAMVNAFQSTYNEIKAKDDKGFSNPESALFDALLTTKNKDFEESINSIVREWEKGTDFTYEEIKEQSLEAYRNLVARYNRLNKPWLKSSETPQSDNRDVQIQALRTELNALKNARSGQQNNSSQPNQFSGQQQNSQSSQNGYFIEPWRKQKTKGDTCFMDGKQWWWCPEHKRTNDFDGLYVTHQPGQGHQDWLERKRRNKRNREASRNGGATQNSNNNSDSALSLVLNDKMRQALLTHHGFDEIQMQAIEDAARQGN